MQSNFWQYQSDINNEKSDWCLEIPSKMAAKISIFILDALTYLQTKFISDYSRRDPVNPVNPNIRKYLSNRNNGNFFLLGNLVKSDYNNPYFHNKSFKTTLKSNSFLMSILRCGLVNLSGPTFPKKQSYKINHIFTCSLKNHWKRIQYSPWAL